MTLNVKNSLGAIRSRLFRTAILFAIVLILFACGGGSDDNATTNNDDDDTDDTTVVTETLAGDITSDMTLTADTVWELDGLVVVTDGATLTIEAGTTIIGLDGTGEDTSYLVIDKDAKIMAEGTADEPIIFTSSLAYNGTAEAPGQWGGVVIIGNAGNDQVGPYECNEDFEAGTDDLEDNSGILSYVEILNSGITMEEDKEINGLSMVGVGSGTTVDHVTVKRSDDDCIEIWGGTVNVTDAYVEYCTDDQFDIDDGYSGTVTGLTIYEHTDGNAGIEMSGTTDATFVGMTLTQEYSDKEGAIYFKKDGIGGHFEDCEIIVKVDNTDYGTFYSTGDATEANISFNGVDVISSLGTVYNFVDDTSVTSSAADIEAAFAAGTGNFEVVRDFDAEPTTVTLSGDITSDMTLDADTLYELDGLVVVTDGATLTIPAGTTLIGLDGTGEDTSYLVIDKDAKIMAEGTADAPIIFTSSLAYYGAAEAPGQWGGVVIIGNAGNDQVGPYECNEDFEAGTDDLADNSGTLSYVLLLNSGITMEEDKEINGLSMVGVGSGTTVENIAVKRSDDDCIEIWGGTVDVDNAYVSYCTDDQFDIDDGYSGTVTDLMIYQHTDGNAGMEMSGTTAATFEGLTLTQDYSDKEGAIYFKKDGIGGYFNNSTITVNAEDNFYDYGTFYSTGDAAEGNISFTNVSVTSPDADYNFVDDTSTASSATDIEAAFTAGTGNSQNEN